MKKFLITLCIICSLSSCTKEHEDETSHVIPDEISAVIEGFNTATKTTINENNELRWSEKDEIAIFNGNNSWKSYRLKNSSIGSTYGKFEMLSQNEGTHDFNESLVIYPSGSLASYPTQVSTSNYSATFNLSSEQKYTKNSFAPGAFPMIGTWNSKPEYLISFKNLLGVLKLQIIGNKTIKSISITGHSDEPLAGDLTVEYRAYSSSPNIIGINNASTSVTLDCGTDGVQLQESTPTYFLIALPEIEFSRGFEINVIDTDGNVYSKKTYQTNKITRSSILRMPVWNIDSVDSNGENIEFEDEVIKELCIKAFDLNNDGELSKGEAAIVTDLSKMVLTKKTFKSFNELKYFTSLKTIPDNYFKGIALRSISFPESLTEIGKNAFYQCGSLKEIEIRGDVRYAAFANCSNLEKVSFLGNTQIIDTYAFQNCSSLSEVTFPQNLTEISQAAFSHCNSLTEIHIPAVETIDTYAFYNCEGLSKVYIHNGLTSIEYFCFQRCKNLQVISLPSTLKNIKGWAFSECTALTEINIPTNNAAINIGENAFENCSSLRTISGLNNIATIGEQAFLNCSALEYVRIPGSVDIISGYAFSNCTALTSVEIDEGTSEIDIYAFNKCSALSDVILPNSLTKIKTGAFSSCKSLEVITLPEITTLGNGVFFNSGLKSISIPESLSEIPEETFQSCRLLETVTIPESIVSISEEAFYNCQSLKSISIPQSVNIIGRAAFYGCSSLQIINIPESIYSLGESIFERCSSLEYIRIPESINIIPDYAFCECYALKNIDMPECIISIGSEAFYGCYTLESISIPASVKTIGPKSFAYCEALQELFLPESVNDIGNGAFEGCIGLKHITIPYGVSRISNCLFNKCSSLTAIELPESIECIENSAFQSCSSLYEITIPSSVKTISDYMFSGCKSLSSVTLLPTNIPSGGGSKIFHNCTTIPYIYVPAELVDAYKKATYWKDYRDKITAIR